MVCKAHIALTIHPKTSLLTKTITYPKIELLEMHHTKLQLAYNKSSTKQILLISSSRYFNRMCRSKILIKSSTSLLVTITTVLSIANLRVLLLKRNKEEAKMLEVK